MADERERRSGVGGLLGGLSTLVESLGELVSRFPADGKEFRQEGEIPQADRESGLKAVYGFTVRFGGAGARTKVEPFGNVTLGEKGEPVVSDRREPLVDVFEESDHILVVAELPGMKEADISTELNGDVLIIKADGEKNRFYKELLLSGRPTTCTTSYLNGILEVHLPRKAAKLERADGPDKRKGAGSSRRTKP